MPAFTINLSDPMLDWALGKANPPAIGTRYITIFNGEPGAGGSEVINAISGSPNRRDLTAAMGLSSGGVAVSTSPVNFTLAAVGAGSINWCAIYDAITGGTLLAKAFVSLKAVMTNDSVVIPAGGITVRLV